VSRPADDREPDPLPLPDWPEGQPEAAADEGGSSWGERWRDNAARREEWFAGRRGEDTQRFEVRGGEVERQPQATVTFEAQNDTELLQRIDRNLDRIVEMLRQIV
jgi:hypothetical protein